MKIHCITKGCILSKYKFCPRANPRCEHFIPSNDQQSDRRDSGVGSNGLLGGEPPASREDQGVTSPLGGDQPPNK